MYKQLVLDSKTWSRGTTSQLLVNDKMCCLGFLCKSLGMKKNQYSNKSCITDCYKLNDAKKASIIDILNKLKNIDSDYNRTIENSIITINDQINNFSDQERINKLEPYFNKLGYTLVLKVYPEVTT